MNYPGVAPPLFLGGGYEKMTKDIKSEIVIGRLPPPSQGLGFLLNSQPVSKLSDFLGAKVGRSLRTYNPCCG